MLGKLKIKIVLLLSAILLTSCLQVEKSELVLTIKKHGKGAIAYNFYGISSDAKGKKAKEEISKLHADVKANKALELNQVLNISHYKESLTTSQSGKLNGKAYGNLSNILDSVKVLFTDDKHKLVSGRKYSIEWDKDILTIKLSDQKITGAAVANNKNAEKQILIVKTEGKFLPGTNGKLSSDKKETRFDLNKKADIVLVIAGLADKNKAKNVNLKAKIIAFKNKNTAPVTSTKVNKNLSSIAKFSKSNTKKVLYHIKDINDMYKLLQNVKKHLDTLGDKNTRVIVVANKAGVLALVDGKKDKLGRSFEPTIQKLANRGVKFEISANYVRDNKVDQNKINLNASFISSGIERIIELQNMGYSYYGSDWDKQINMLIGAYKTSKESPRPVVYPVLEKRVKNVFFTHNKSHIVVRVKENKQTKIRTELYYNDKGDVYIIQYKKGWWNLYTKGDYVYEWKNGDKTGVKVKKDAASLVNYILYITDRALIMTSLYNRYNSTPIMFNVSKSKNSQRKILTLKKDFYGMEAMFVDEKSFWFYGYRYRDSKTGLPVTWYIDKPISYQAIPASFVKEMKGIKFVESDETLDRHMEYVYTPTKPIRGRENLSIRVCVRESALYNPKPHFLNLHSFKHR